MQSGKGVVIMQNTLLCISLSLIGGLLMSRLAKKAGLPAVTAYLITGLLLGPYCIGRLDFSGVGFHTMSDIKTFEVFSDTALGFIAFTIGNEFRISELRSMGRQAITIGILQAVVTTIIVDTALIALHLLFPAALSLPSAITLGAIAAATAPAATLMVVRQYQADGPLTKLLLMVVAIDDAVGLVLFSVSFGIAGALEQGGISVLTVVVEPFVEIVLSLLLGALLLVCMMTGTVFCNVCSTSAALMERLDRWTTPLSILFFILSGAELDLKILRNPIVLLIGAVYIISRAAGKIFGAYSSCALTGCTKNVQRHLGITLLPQAGVALGMALTAASLSDGEMVRNVLLFSVLVYELIGPTLTKNALIDAGEIHAEEVQVPAKA